MQRHVVIGSLSPDQTFSAYVVRRDSAAASALTIEKRLHLAALVSPRLTGKELSSANLNVVNLNPDTSN
jgi:hypothetical protein